MAWAPFAIMAVSAAASAVSSAQQGNAAAAAQSFNAAQGQVRAQTDIDQANAQAAIDKQNTQRRLGEAFAAAGASGVDPGQGSPLSVMSDLAAQGELTRRLTLYKGAVAATGDLNAASGALFAGNQAQQAGYARGITTLLGTAAQAGLSRASSGPSSSGLPQFPTMGPSYSGAPGSSPGGLPTGGRDYGF